MGKYQKVLGAVLRLKVIFLKNVIQKYINLFPDADHYTLSYHDIHPDHAACGQALQDLYNAGKIQYYVRFIISMATRDDYESRGAAIPGGGL